MRIGPSVRRWGAGLLLLGALVCQSAPGSAVWGADSPPAIRQVKRSAITGHTTFATVDSGAVQSGVSAVDHRLSEPSAFVQAYAHHFGVADSAEQLIESGTRRDSLGFMHTTFRQHYRGVAVFSGVLKVHQDASGQVYAANGHAYRLSHDLDVTARVSAQRATVIAAKALAVGHPQTERSELVIVDPGWYGETPIGARLAYYLVLSDPGVPLREAFFVDAGTGAILDRWSMLHTARVREVYDAMQSQLLPGVLVRGEGDPPSSDEEADAAYDYAGDAYDFYFRAFGRDSLDNAGKTIRLSINSTRGLCPNAYWSGGQAVFCTGAVSDDVTAHEITHGVIERTADLIYKNQPGQLNEGFADIFGELVDLFNGDVAAAGPPATAVTWPAHESGSGLDLPNLPRSTCSTFPGYVDGVRWLIGEDAQAFSGAIRDMWNPPCFGHPDRANSPLQTCSGFDNGGVHSGSGIPNHAFAILTDGKVFNGHVVQGIGAVKAAAVWYRALTTYLTPASNFADAYVALNQAAQDLIGSVPNDPRTGLPSGSAFTAADAVEVNKSLLAVEMNTAGACGSNTPGPANDVCARAVCLFDGQAYVGSTTGATGTDVSSCAFDDAFDVWFTYTPTVSEPITFSLCGSALDTTLAVFDGCDGTELVCGDDECGDGATLASEVTLPGVAGVVYFIRVAGFDRQSGDFVLRVVGGAGACIGCDPPAAPDQPQPADGQMDVDATAALAWHAADGDILLMGESSPSATCSPTFRVLLDSVNPPETVACDGLTVPQCDLGGLPCGRTFFWRVEADYCCVTVRSPVWTFTTVGCPCLGDGDCDDSEPCTLDRCENLICVHEVVSCGAGQVCDELDGQCRDEFPACAGQLLVNPGFEEGGDAWLKSHNGGRVVVSGTARTGSHSQQMSVHPQLTREVIQSVGVSSGARYAAAGWIRADNVGGNGAQVELRWLDGQQALLRVDVVGGLTGTQDWTRVFTLADAPVAAAAVDFVLFTDVDADGVGTAWFDDLSFCMWPQCCDAPLAGCVACACPTAGVPRLYVGAPGSGSVALLDGESGALSSVVLGAPGGLPVAVDGMAYFEASGRLYVGDKAGHAIHVYEEVPDTCQFSLRESLDADGEPLDLAFGRDGFLYVADYSANQVTRLDEATGQVDSGFQFNGCGLAGPTGLLFLADGRLLIANDGRKNILFLDPSTGACGVFARGCGLNSPRGMAQSNHGDILVVNQLSDSVVRFDRCGECLGTLIAPGACGLLNPSDIVLTSTGLALVAGSGNDGVLAFDALSGVPWDLDSMAPGVQCVFGGGGSVTGPAHLVLSPAVRDCNGNGVADAQDLASGTSVDCDGSGIPDECEPAVRIVASNPVSGAIDARQPTALDGSGATGWRSVTLTFNCYAACVDPSEFSIHAALGTPPRIEGVVVNGTEVTIQFDDMIPLRDWTIVVHRPSGTTACLGYLPGDVSGSRASNALDVIALVDHLNGIRPRPMYATDINRSNLASAQDILRLIDLLNGAGAFASWFGRTLPPVPCRSCAVDADCDDGRYCNGPETCEGGQCIPGFAVACDDLVGCTTDSCDETTDACRHLPIDALCDDGAVCNGAETCDPAVGCLPGTTVDCDDGVACTIDGCDEGAGGCVHVPDATACDDGLFCNGVEVCDVAAGCVVGEPPCDDSVDCTLDACDEVLDACAHFANELHCDDGVFCNGAEVCDPQVGCRGGTPIDCSDGMLCTVDTCDEAGETCVHTPDDGVCDDGLICNGVESCDMQLGCVPGTPIECEDGVACTLDACDEAAGGCVYSPNIALCDDGLFCNGAETCDPGLGCQSGVAVDCDDGLDCTVDTCDEGAAACVNAPDDTQCTDGQYCNGLEHCDVAVGCLPGPYPCDDGVGCTLDACDEANETCENLPHDAPCDDGVYCNGAEFCDLTMGCMAGIPIDCDDGISCTVDSCDEAQQSCLHAPEDAPCANGVFCDGAESCDPLVGCVPGVVVACDDGVDCTVDVCDEAAGACVHVPDDQLCDDGLLCNGVETCNALLGCVAGVAVDCDDGVDCTVDVCDEAAGACVHVPDDQLCDDGLLCNGVEMCNALLGCVAGVVVDCDDGVNCTVDTCDEASQSCVHAPDDAACDNGLLCDGVETCDPLLGCVAGVAVDCDDGVDCTVDTCDEAAGACAHVPDDKMCDDGLFCNGAETCDALVGCVAGVALNCDDGVDCTVDSCDEVSGACLHMPDDGMCDDGLFCNGVETCDALLGCQTGQDPCPGALCFEVVEVCFP